MCREAVNLEAMWELPRDVLVSLVLGHPGKIVF